MNTSEGTLRSIRVRDTDAVIARGWHVILIARHPGPLQKLVDDGRLEHIPALSPSSELVKKVAEMKKRGEWNKENFQNYFVSDFLEETESEEFCNALNNLFIRVKKGENIALTCFCGDAEMCHRSIVIGLLQAVGVKTLGPDYSPYWLIRQVSKHTKEEKEKERAVPKPEQQRLFIMA